MSSVWFCIPSARPVAEVNACIDKWREKGYRVALWRDKEEEGLHADLVMVGSPYPGYAAAVNTLAKHVLMLEDPSCDYVVSGGDDYLPSMVAPQNILADLHKHFAGSTFAVMQPTGDPYADRCIERIAGSPWLGREWCLRAHQGAGPFHPTFTHMFSDEALKCVAEKLGVYWARPDLTHYHNHFMRVGDDAMQRPVPPHLAWCNTPEHWNSSKAKFEQLMDSGFAGCEPLPELVNA